jgi:hypothetical protein
MNLLDGSKGQKSNKSIDFGPLYYDQKLFVNLIPSAKIFYFDDLFFQILLIY